MLSHSVVGSLHSAFRYVSCNPTERELASLGFLSWTARLLQSDKTVVRGTIESRNLYQPHTNNFIDR